MPPEKLPEKGSNAKRTQQPDPTDLGLNIMGGIASLGEHLARCADALEDLLLIEASVARLIRGLVKP